MDMLALDSELIEIREALAQSQRLERQLIYLAAALKSEQVYHGRLVEQVAYSQTGLQPVEPVFSALFFAYMGAKGGRFDRHRQEQLAARLKLENSCQRIGALEREQVNLSGQRAGLVGIEQHYHDLLDGKENALGQAGEQMRRLVEQSGMLAAARVKRRELRDIQRAGEQAQAGLARASEALSDANRWGAWDLFSENSAANGAQRSRFDSAYAAIQAAQPLLLRFECELAGGPAQDGRGGGLAAFADIVVDGLLVDLLAQCEISESIDSIRAVARRVSDLREDINTQLDAAGRAEQVIETKRRILIGRLS